MNIENTTNEQTMPERAQTETGVKPLEFTNDIGEYLKETGKWSKFLSILGFIGMGLIAMLGLVLSIVMSFIPGGDSLPFPSFLFGLIYLFIGAIYFIPILYLFRFSNDIQQAFRSKNQIQLVNAFNYLRKHYRFIGILMIIFLGLYILGFLMAIVAGFFSGVGGFANTMV